MKALDQIYMEEPYRLFFPLGVVFIIVGLVPWILFGMGCISFYPRELHANAMVGGFLIQFSVGFLMTAIPKFMGTHSATTSETSFALAISLLSLMSASLDNTVWSEVLSLMLLLFLIFFAAKRFLKRQWTPPPAFLFLPVGFLAGVLGCSMLIAGNQFPALIAPGRLLFYEAMMLAFVVGIGAKLVTALLGWGPLPQIKIEVAKKSKWLETYTFSLLAFLFALAFLLQCAGYQEQGQILKAGVVLFVGITKWKLHRFPKERGSLANGVHHAALFIIFGVLLPLFPFFQGTHWAHILYIGGFALLTFFIASRVTLAHGGFDLSIEKKYWVLRSMFLSITITVALRVLSGLIPDLFSSATVSAASILLFSSLLWAYHFVPRMKVLKSSVL